MVAVLARWALTTRLVYYYNASLVLPVCLQDWGSKLQALFISYADPDPGQNDNVHPIMNQSMPDSTSSSTVSSGFASDVVFCSIFVSLASYTVSRMISAMDKAHA